MRSIWHLFSGGLALLIALAISVGTCALWYFGSPTFQTIHLRPGEEVSFSVLRLKRERPHLTLLFSRVYGATRPELGHWDSEQVSRNGKLELEAPGATIKASVEIAGERGALIALPSTAGDMTHWERVLVPASQAGSPSSITWPPRWESIPRIDPLFAKIRVKILEADSSIANESVSIALSPPMARTRVEQGYEMFRWFSYIPINLVVVSACLVFGFRDLRNASRSGAK